VSEFKILFYDTETSGFLQKGAEKLPAIEQPWIVQMGMILTDGETDFHRMSFMINSIDREISPGAEKVHGISREMTKNGISELMAAAILSRMLTNADLLVCHNVAFDIPMTALMYRRIGEENDALRIEKFPSLCTMKETTDFCAIPTKWGKPKWPKLEELEKKLFGFCMEGAHDALNDCEKTRKCYFELKDRKII
jgi:DNA polymerase-3 subunit epsilon